MPGVSVHFSFELILQFVKIVFNSFVDCTPQGAGNRVPSGLVEGTGRKDFPKPFGLRIRA